MQLGAQATVDAEELLVHNSGQGQAAERVHTGLVHGLGVFVPAFELEGEVIGQMAAFVVSAKQPEGLGIVDLERPEVENAFYAEITTVDIVAKEQIPSLGRVAADLEQFH